MQSSPLGVARVRRRLTLEEAAARADLSVEEAQALEENRIYRFPTVEQALGITRREARHTAGLATRTQALQAWSLRRWLTVAVFTLACAGLLWLGVLDRLVDRGGSPTAVTLPERWEIEVTVYNGTRVPNAAAGLANEIAGLAYRIDSVGNAKRRDYPATRVYYPPGGYAIGKRLADELGVEPVALPGGDDPQRLVVIVGSKPS